MERAAGRGVYIFLILVIKMSCLNCPCSVHKGPGGLWKDPLSYICFPKGPSVGGTWESLKVGGGPSEWLFLAMPGDRKVLVRPKRKEGTLDNPVALEFPTFVSLPLLLPITV